MAWKGTAESRGYDWAWKKRRAQILKRDGYVCVCENCKRADRVLPATHVDHIVSKAKWRETHGNLDGVDGDTNLQSMNVDCHKLKTLLEKGHQPDPGCDLNGWPRDPSHPWNQGR